MRLRNSADSFGAVSIALHWLIGLSILGMIVFGTQIANMKVGFSNLWLFALHKSLGLTLLALIVLRIAWHRISPPPPPIPSAHPVADRLARAVHRALYALMLAIPLAGWVASSASGIDTLWFGVPVPAIAPPVGWLEDAGFAAHRWLAWALLALVALHVAGAVKRQVLDRDGTLLRMIGKRRR